MKMGPVVMLNAQGKLASLPLSLMTQDFNVNTLTEQMYSFRVYLWTNSEILSRHWTLLVIVKD